MSTMQKNIPVKITTLSPLHLGSGKANVVIDAEVVHDKYGIPYFPGKRIKGLLYESALELWEMLGDKAFSRKALDELFQRTYASPVELIIHNFVVEDYENLSSDLAYLQNKYKNILASSDVLDHYTHVRYQTKIIEMENDKGELNENAGTAAEGSLRNLRVVDGGIVFQGELELVNAAEEHELILALALQNLKYAGAKRNRGFGEIKCSIDNEKQEKCYKKLIEHALGRK